MLNYALAWDDVGKLGYTANFLAKSPTWEDISEVVGFVPEGDFLRVNDAMIDWHSPYITSGFRTGVLGAYVVTTQTASVKIYYIDDLQADTLSATLLHTYTMNSSGTTIARIVVSRDTTDLVAVHWLDDLGCRYGESTDGGSNWSSIKTIGSAYDASGDRHRHLGLALDGSHRLVTGNDGSGNYSLYHSTDGSTFSKLSGAFNSSTPLKTINAEDGELYYTVTSASKVYRVDNYQTSPSHTEITPATGYDPVLSNGFSLDPNAPSKIAMIGFNAGTQKLYLSADGGDNWTDKGTVSDWGVDRTDNNLLTFNANRLYYSPDLSDTELKKFGTLDNVFPGYGLYISGITHTFSLLSKPTPKHEVFKPNGLCHVAEPISGTGVVLRTAEKIKHVTDLAVSTPSGALAFTRTYRQSKLSDDEYQFMGLGWTHNHNIRIREDVNASPNTINLYYCNGSEIHYEKTSTDHYDGVAGASSYIDVDTGSSNARYTLKSKNNSVYVFEVYDTNKGRIVSHTRPSGEIWDYTYDGNGRLSTVEDSAYDIGSGAKRKLTFTYHTTGSHIGQLKRVTDHSNRYVELSYIADHDGGSNSLLDSVDDVNGNGWSYEHEDTVSGQLNLLKKVKTPSVDTTGNGTADGEITVEELSYTLSGSTITSITEKIGAQGANPNLYETEYNFQPDGKNITEELVADKAFVHVFSGGVRSGLLNAVGDLGFGVVNDEYRGTTQIDGNGNPTIITWDNDNTHPDKATDALGNETSFSYNSDETLQQSTDAEGRKNGYIYNTGLRQPVMTLISDDASELDINGGMEDNSGWSAITSATNNQSTTQVDTGDNAWYVNASSADGIKSASWTLVADKTYAIMARVYPVSGTVKLAVSGSSDWDTTSDGTGAWETLRAVHTPTSGASKTLNVLADGGSAEFYVDSVHLVEIDNLMGWQEFIYDDKGRVLSQATINETTAALQQLVTRVYHTSGNGNGLLQSETRHDVEDAGNNSSTTYTYDAAGQVVKTQKSSLFGTCEFSYTVYDDTGNVVATVCGPQNTTAPTTVAAAEAMYDVNDSVKKYNRVTVHEYDELGRRFKTTSNAGMDIEQTNLTVYDVANRVIRNISNYVADVSVPNPFTAAHTAFDHGTEENENLVTDTVYNERNLVRKQTDVLGTVTLMGYDDAGRLVKTVRSASSPSYDNSYGVSGDPDLSAYTVSSNLDEDLITEQVYDSAGNLVKSIDVDGNVSFTVYDALNRGVKSVGNAKDAATIDLNVGDASYNASNDPRLDSYVPSDDPDRDFISTTEYDSLGRVIRTQTLLETRPSEVWNTTLMGYDEQGRQIKTIRNAATPTYNISSDPDLSNYTESSAVDEDHISETVFDDKGRTLYTIALNGNKNWTAYDGLGRTIKSISNAVGTATDGGSNDPRSASYTPSSDADKDLVSETYYDSDGRVQRTKDVLGRWTLNGYDEQGRQIKTIRNASDDDYFDTAMPADPDLSAYTPSANSDEDITSETVYDDQGRVLQTIDTRGNETYVVYDSGGRRVTSITNYVQQSSSDPADWFWSSANKRWEYSVGNAVSHGTDKDQNIISTTSYEFGGRVSKTRNHTGIETRYEYDDLGRQVKTIFNYVDGIYSAASPDEDLISETIYNRAGQVTETIDARGTKTQFAYDKAGRRLTVTEAAETAVAATSYTCYDKAGQVLRAIDNWRNDPAEASPDEMDGSGDWVFNPTKHGAYNDQDLVTAYSYDKAGRVVSITDPLGYTTNTVYYKDGRIKSVTDPKSTVAQYRYDELNRPELVVEGYVAQATDPENWVWSSGNSRWEDS